MTYPIRQTVVDGVKVALWDDEETLLRLNRGEVVLELRLDFHSAVQLQKTLEQAKGLLRRREVAEA